MALQKPCLYSASWLSQFDLEQKLNLSSSSRFTIQRGMVILKPQRSQELPALWWLAKVTVALKMYLASQAIVVLCYCDQGQGCHNPIEFYLSSSEYCIHSVYRCMFKI